MSLLFHSLFLFFFVSASDLILALSASTARGGQLETLQWLRAQKDFHHVDGSFTDACEGGHLEIMKWLRSEGCPWDKWGCTCTRAAQHGHLEILKWLRSEGCPWGGITWVNAASGDHLEILKWLRSEGCPWDGRTWHHAAESTREWLRENGFPQDW